MSLDQLDVVARNVPDRYDADVVDDEGAIIDRALREPATPCSTPGRPTSPTGTPSSRSPNAHSTPSPHPHDATATGSTSTSTPTADG